MDATPAVVPPYELQSLVDAVLSDADDLSLTLPKILCAQGIGPDLYAGCSNGELLRLSLHRDSLSEIGSYSLVSRQGIPSGKAVDDIVLTASISRALVLSDRNIFIYTLPNLDLVGIQPMRNVVTFAVDEQHIRRGPPKTDSLHHVDPIDLCVLKRTSIALYSLRERLIFQKDIPLPSRATLARRTGKYLCFADQQFYNMIDLEAASLFQLLPLSQAEDSGPVKPFILVISDNEFLILSWTGASTLGLFITGDGDPVRGTLEWPKHPKAVTFDDPYVMTLMPDDSIEIHSIESQTLVQTIPPPIQPFNLPPSMLLDRTALFSARNGLFVPSAQRSTKLRKTSVPLLRNTKKAATENVTTTAPNDDLESELIDPL
ncbi:hypothetical protein BDY19DRAFT_620665 [Irpex rosettiformis]|uniref:Uncharacterized protein n=1 Tax=Irpex rosettiformis TaxID=378272 RepID=A0ACB8TNQ4_9APHY|nr:hypothetical protein BDY19DRAFT_620665 [Irpex rosettiformis]